MCAMTSLDDMAKVIIDGDEQETLIDIQLKRIDRMGRVYISRDLADKEVKIIVMPIKPGDKEKYLKIGRDS